MTPEELLRKLDVKVDSLVEGQLRHSGILSEHIRRTELAEENIELLRAELKPVALHVAVVGALGKVVGLLGVLVGIAVGVWKLLGH